MKLKLKRFMEILVKIKKCLICNYSTKSKYHDDLEKLVNGEIKDKIGGFAIEKFVGLDQKICFFLVD